MMFNFHRFVLGQEYKKAMEDYDSEDFGMAETRFRRVLQGHEMTHGIHHKETLCPRDRLASCLYELEKYVEAEKEYRISVSAHEVSLGELHERTLRQRHWLAQTLYRQHRFTEAEAQFERAASGQEILFGKDNEDFLDSRYWQGIACYRQQKLANAEEHLVCTLHGRQKTLGTDKPFTLQSQFWLGRIFCCNGKFTEAEIHLRRALHGLERLRGEMYKNTLLSRFWLGLTCYRQRNVAEAQDHLRQAFHGLEQTFGKDHGWTRSSKAWLQMINCAQRGYPEAEEMFDSLEALALFPDALFPAISSHSNDVRESPLGQIDQILWSREESNPHFTDSEIMEISNLLKQAHPRWSTVPRTYIVLRGVHSLVYLDDLIARGFSDYWLPATERSLPSCLVGSSRSMFVAIQALVLTQSLGLERADRGRHCYFKQGEPLPFKEQQRLGAGGCSQVDRVMSLISFKEYARKLVRRSTILQGKAASYMKLLIKEIEILKRLQHRHVVRLVGSYTDPKHIALLMSPVAEMDLSAYLDLASSNKHGELRTFFGCLTRALEFLHRSQIRHKDIKPHNILIDRGNILFTDFGLSHDFSDSTGSTTVSMVNMRTARYCAPEVALQEPRNTSSDIWSLGVVFLEMAVVLKGESIEWMRQFFRANGSQLQAIYANREALVEIMNHLQAFGRVGDNEVLVWIDQMLEERPRSRPRARELVQSMIAAGHQGDVTFCGMCCSIPEEDWDTASVDPSESPATIDPVDFVESINRVSLRDS